VVYLITVGSKNSDLYLFYFLRINAKFPIFLMRKLRIPLTMDPPVAFIQVALCLGTELHGRAKPLIASRKELLKYKFLMT
jgi:hypothetical protein